MCREKQATIGVRGGNPSVSLRRQLPLHKGAFGLRGTGGGDAGGGVRSPRPTEGTGEVDRHVGPKGLLAMTIIFCHSEERSGVGIRSFVGGLVCAGVSGRPRRAAPTQC